MDGQSYNSQESPEQSLPINATTCDNITFTFKNSLNPTGSQTDVNWAHTCKYFGTQDKLFSCLPKTGLKICHININSIVRKLSELKIVLQHNPFHVVAVSETKCDATISDSELDIENYNIFRKDRNRHGGGVALYVKDDVSCRFENNITCDDIEALWVKLSPKHSETLLICVIYRPPNSSSSYFDLLNEMLSQAVTNTDVEMILLGDLNCDMCPNNIDSLSRSLEEMMSGFLFDQLIDVPTRVTTTSQTIIELIYSTDVENHSLNGVLKTSFSDHYMIFTVYGDADITQKENIIEWRDFKGFEFAEFNFFTFPSAF